MTAPTVALLPSPFLGPALWEPVADRLRAAGRDVRVTGHGPVPPADGAS